MATKEEADITFLTARGDALLVLVKQLLENKRREVTMIETIVNVMDTVDGSIQFVGEGASDARSRVVELLKATRPKETEGMSDEEILRLVGGTNGNKT